MVNHDEETLFFTKGNHYSILRGIERMPKIIWRRRTSCPKCGSLDIKREDGIRLEYCGKCGTQWVVPRNKKLKNSIRDY